MLDVWLFLPISLKTKLKLQENDSNMFSSSAVTSRTLR